MAKAKKNNRNTSGGTAKKPKNMAKVPITTSNKATAELSAALDRVPREKEGYTASKKTIAARTANIKNNGHFPIARWVILGPLALAAFIFKFCMAGYSFSALVCLCLMGVILFYNLTFLWGRKNWKLAKMVRGVFVFLLCIGLLVACVTEGLIVKASFGSSDADVTYFVILGAKVRSDRPSQTLTDRIEAAYNYMVAHPDTIAIASGGKGNDEPISEAQCIFDQLVARGIDPARIWIEDQASSTWENINFSLDLIEKNSGSRPTRIGVLSSEYHLFRASLFAKECGVDFVGIPAKTSIFSLKINYFLREAAGVWHYILLGGQYYD